MKFQIQDLKKLLYSVQQNHINTINIISKHLELTINKDYENKYKKWKPKKTIIRQEEHENLATETLKHKTVSNNEANTYLTIISPMVGTFYRSPAPNEFPFVKLYDMVQKQQTVCIIEAMKLMNEIEAEVTGEIVEILVQDGEIIDCGQALMRVKPNVE